jgi:starch synthase (maltosyl-transferring)
VDEITKKNVPGANLNSELLEGLVILKTSAALAPGPERTRINGLINAMESALAVGEQQGAIDLGIGGVMRSLMASCPDRSEGYELAPALTIMVNRPVTRFAAWYEFFPRSQGTMPYRHGTLQDSIRRLHEIKAMGFDVVYLPPIHPIGHSFRKGKNNSLVPYRATSAVRGRSATSMAATWRSSRSSAPGTTGISSSPPAVSWESRLPSIT